MTADELAAAIAAEQGGRLVIESVFPLSIGAIVRAKGFAGLTETRLRVVSESCPSEFEAQCDGSCRLSGAKRGTGPNLMAFFYQVEAAD